jgi:endonuclease-3
MNCELKKKQESVRSIVRLLRKEYGTPPARNVTDPLDVLIRTILSQNTSDVNSNRAFDELKERFEDWDSVRHASRLQIEAAIRSGGLAKTKARRIKDILSRIHDLYGRMSLDPICDMEPNEASSFLSSLKGVGPKTVHCVLLFGCGLDVFPVDTHILRISKRLGLIPGSTGLGPAHILWAELLPQGAAYSLHLNLIEHGRRTCHARNPQCLSCCLRHCCKFSLSH